MEGYLLNVSGVKKFFPKWLKRTIKNIIFPIAVCRYELEVKRREKYSVFDYKQLAADMSLVTQEYGYNAFYGIANVVKEKFHLPKRQPINGIVEHGFALPPDDISEIDHPFDTVYVMGKIRQEYLQKRFPEKKIYSIGPYIQYVKSFQTIEWIEKQRKRFGKTLLVFPSHSTHHVNMTFNKTQFFSEVERIRVRYSFSTVLVCLYWKDILLHLDDALMSREYQIVTAGHIYDPNFLLRLKSIFLLADIAMGNSIGTHIGYAIACDVPYYFYDSPPKYSGENVDYSDEQMILLRKQFLKFFGDYRENITSEARDFVEEYWGSWTVKNY